MSELDAERKKILDELDDCTARFSAAATGAQPPKAGSALIDIEIRNLFRRYYDRYFTPKEVTEHLQRLGWRIYMPYVRTKLARLAKRNVIRKAGHGRYMGKG
ncbi:MAG TPA: hypothetical protein VF381_02620 [Thermoanaerobaculia bacterium]